MTDEELVSKEYVEAGEEFSFNKVEPEESKDWIFTFGYNHIWPLTGTSMGKNYVALHGTYEATREEMNRRFSHLWSFQYDSKEKAGVDRYELAELRLENVEVEYR